MNEFRIHHDVNELLSLLQVRGGGDGAEGYIDLLQKHRTPYDFLRKYDELKSKNVRTLDPLVYLLSKLSEDKETLQCLQQNAKERSESSANATSTTSYTLPSTTTKMSMQELDELRKKLGNVTASSNAPQMLRERHNKKNPTQPNPVFPNWVYDRPALIGDFITGPSGPVGDPLLTYIAAQPVLGRQNRSFIVDPTLALSIKELVNRILPEKSSFEYGQVNQALTAAMRTLMKEYMILVTQLEHLHRQGPALPAEALPAADRTFNFTGDSQAQELCLYLTKAASVPYFEILEKWVYRGALLELALRMSTANTDPFKDNLKYLNVVRECGWDVTCLEAKEVLYTLKERDYVEQIEKAYNCASKHYFLMDKGDFVVHFMDLTEDELKKPVDLIVPSRLEALLELALRMSTANTDPFKDNLKIELMPHNVITQLLRVLAIETKQEKAFMVEEHELQKEKIQEDYNNKYWDQRKYLNVVRECGWDVTCLEAKEVLYTLKERDYVEQIEKAYNCASKHYFLMDKGDFVVHFMDLTEDELKKPVDLIVPSRLEALLELALRMSTANTDPFKDNLKHYFLMDKGDFVVHFMDLTEDELKKPVDLIVPSRLEALLELALRMSTANTDPFKDNLKIELMPHNVITQLLRVLAIETKQEKAVSHALTRYQMLFRHIFYCKHVERLLCNVFSAAFALRQRMLNFVQNIQYYMMFEVMEPTWHASNIDDVLCHHTSFLDNCLKDCMLTNQELLRIFSRLMSDCITFTSHMQCFAKSMSLDRLSLEHAAADAAHKPSLKSAAELADALQAGGGFEAAIGRFDSNFSSLLLDLLDKLNIYSTNDCEHSMINIMYRLDFNGFYTERLTRMAMERIQKAAAV
ncbi:hypothetical protein CRUP_033294 [Coryphaenoides rupestris]|nr:hypothetical protein CRUP_033294 [Coryphaenoides rupestris]